MSRGRYTKHTREEAERIAKMREKGLTWQVIKERTGMSDGACRVLIRKMVR